VAVSAHPTSKVALARSLGLDAILLTMSFRFLVGDLIGAANLTYNLIKALHGCRDASKEYRAAIDELGHIQQAFIKVSCLGANKSNHCDGSDRHNTVLPRQDEEV
jgi:hypothetical protein